MNILKVNKSNIAQRANKQPLRDLRVLVVRDMFLKKGSQFNGI